MTAAEEGSVSSQSNRATLYRMVLPDHVCPFGERAKAMLLDHGFEVDDCLLTSRDEVDAFKAEHGLATTPLIVIAGEKIGGSADLAEFLRGRADKGATAAEAGAFDF